MRASDFGGAGGAIDPGDDLVAAFSGLSFPIIFGALAAGVFGSCVVLLDLSMWRGRE
jgi:hypothetical protein